MAWLRYLILLPLAVLVVGCATVPPYTATNDRCEFTPHVAEVPPPPAAIRNQSELATPPPEQFLLMSGGGEDGAFGAGVLVGWQKANGGHLPRFSTVTGISTGAMLSTFAFLDRPHVAAKDYDIQHESQILQPYARLNGAGGFTASSYIAIARHNAVGDLSPLKELLLREISWDVVGAVAKEAADRKLLVGAVDVDSGDAVIFDLTEMATKAVDRRYPAAERERYRRCYVDAILASGSEPLAAPPVFIDNRQYIDGGARYGLFLTGLGSSVKLRPALQAATAKPDNSGGVLDLRAGSGANHEPEKLPAAPYLYLLVNGTQVISPHCGKLPGGGGSCGPDGRDPFTNYSGAHDRWNLLKLAARSSSILINQIYRFSVSDIYSRYEATYGSAEDHVIYMPMIPAELERFPSVTDNCASRKKADFAKSRPLEFHPEYMRCLMKYGEDYALNRSRVLTSTAPVVPPGLQNAIGQARVSPLAVVRP